MKLSQLSLAAALLLGAASCNSSPDSVKEAQQTNEAKIDSTTKGTGQNAAVRDDKEKDSEFLTKAASGGMLEVQMGSQVAKRAQTPGAKQAAQKMVSDHTKANAELKALAAKKNITLPTVLGEEQQKVYNDVLAKKGIDLDKEYVKQMVKDHKDDIKEFTDGSTNTGDPEIRAYASKNIPVLQMHLAMFEKLQHEMDAKK
ncbi:hypothetical protein GCM10023172_24590 [Hymenobacter ginsengisoli]|uniref:DUF4142 domain-containing protein n=1 Tax=Hymenobacter ginsengisoli TaxID=1051626 RepID=A0ABP8QG33_9BACT|nr:MULTISPECIES: DUF4142 domain-containing protein [unclassified Hymenobacter]MBO2033149.1 DUF4142 domain-containing protein [Hymenobacter sp. BT559]